MQFAKSGGRLSGELRREDAPRLADILAPVSEPVQYQLSGSVESGRPVLRLNVKAAVSLVCQRCLGTYVQALALDRVLPIARDEAQLGLWERDDPLLDALVADADMVVAELVEDEVLLSLPTVPRHPEGGCDEQARAILQ
ncbi:MAG: YceD family protein [Pseudomonadota bacterium]